MTCTVSCNEFTLYNTCFKTKMCKVDGYFCHIKRFASRYFYLLASISFSTNSFHLFLVMQFFEALTSKVFAFTGALSHLLFSHAQTIANCDCSKTLPFPPYLPALSFTPSFSAFLQHTPLQFAVSFHIF